MNPGRIVAAATGALGLLGLGTTLLPLLTLKGSENQFSGMAIYGGYGALDEFYGNSEDTGDTITAHLGFFDFGTLSAPVVSLIPVALGLVAVLGILQAVRGTQRGAAAATALLALVPLLVVIFTWISPIIALSGTGHYSKYFTKSTSDVNTGIDISPGIGLIFAGIALVLILAAAAYQSVMELLEK